MFKSLRKIFEPNDHPRRQVRRSVRLAVQPLEDRKMMALLGGADVTLKPGSWGHELHIDASRSPYNEVLIETGHPTIYNTVKLTINGNTSNYEGLQRVFYKGGNGEDIFRNFTMVGCTATGYGGQDTLIGGGGADALYGGEDVDKLEGGGAYGITVNGTFFEGTDFLWGGNGDDKLTGGWSKDTLFGGGGKDVLSGLGYDDLLVGDGDNGLGEPLTDFGDDTLNGGAGNDVYSFSAKSGGTDTIGDDGGLNELDFRGFGYGVTVDLSKSGKRDVSPGNPGKLSLVLTHPQTIKTVHGTYKNDTLIGNNLANVLNGHDGNDKLEGRGSGIPGERQVLAGGFGNDIYVFRNIDWEDSDIVDDTGEDTLDFSNMTKGVNVDLALTSLTATASNLFISVKELETIEKVIGSKYRDVIRGDDRSNTLEGGGENDVLEGRRGDDILNGGLHNDSYEFSGKYALGRDTIVGNEDVNTLDFSRLGFGGIQVDLAVTGKYQEYFKSTTGASQLKFDAGAVDNVFGTNWSDILKGDGQANKLWGGKQHDVLWGRGGNDELYGEDGTDLLWGGFGQDKLTGGDKCDIFLTEPLDTPLDMNLAQDERIAFSGSWSEAEMDAMADGVREYQKQTSYNWVTPRGNSVTFLRGGVHANGAPYAISSVLSQITFYNKFLANLGDVPQLLTAALKTAVRGWRG